MIVFPKYQLRPRYLGEQKVYELLARIRNDDGFAVHSLNLPEHQYKRWGEADFVIVNRSGVTLLEIKGGVVTLAGREWRYENGRGQAILSTEGPARQALTAAIALEKLLSEHVGRKVRCRWGVCFPLCSFSKTLAELPKSRLADIRTCKDEEAFQQWLEAIPFDPHGAEDFALEPNEVKNIREIIVPELSAAISLGLAVRSAQERVIQLTDQQFAILESLEANRRLCVSGGAGTGKTELVALSARADQAAGWRPAIVTTGKTLFHSLRGRMAAIGIPVVTSKLPSGTDTLIVDEGQDFANAVQLGELFSQLPGGLENGRWRWFMDPNLQFMDAPPDPDCLSAIASNSVAVNLTRNVRSTREIVSTVRLLLGADVGISQVDGYGIKVGMHRVDNAIAEAERAHGLIYDLLGDGILPSDIAVLGPRSIKGPVCASLLKKHPEIFRPLADDGQIQSSGHGVVCGIADFRGLEARVVLLVDMDYLPEGKAGESMLYIGMSRASASLDMLVSPVFGGILKSLVKKSFERD